MKIEKIWKDIDDAFMTVTIKIGEKVTLKDINNAVFEYLGIKTLDTYLAKERQQVLYKDFKIKPKVIFNDPATILFMNGKKYVSKAHDEPFDEEKGLLMCLAKAQGISHLELKRMIKGAKREYKPLPPKERKSINGVSVKKTELKLAKKRGRPKQIKEGDLVKVIKSGYINAQDMIGQTFRVEYSTKIGIAVYNPKNDTNYWFKRSDLELVKIKE